ncbi:MAG: phosphoribosyl-ATP pyrophosphatase, partial [Candidatus Limnocylindrales bacterium]
MDAVGREVTEEATEVLLAAKDDAAAGQDTRPATQAHVAGETADLQYHVLVLLAARDLPPSEVLDVLRAR